MSETPRDGAPRKRRWLVALPLIVFAALAALFWVRLGDRDISRIPLGVDRAARAANHIARA